jgi:hypothetical protein
VLAPSIVRRPPTSAGPTPAVAGREFRQQVVTIGGCFGAYVRRVIAARVRGGPAPDVCDQRGAQLITGDKT